ncbi:MAG: nodulation protein NfeD [Chloroflexi bacterium]|nr:nodulation protein NfeD [Chloroflexota bacterium]
MGALGLAIPARAASDTVVVIELDTIIHPIAERYLERALQQAADDGAAAIVIKIDTPGGLLTSTREIVTHLFESPVPVIVYVSPAGARAASAGTFITAAGHIAAMAPGTNIGAASPISGDGSDISDTLKDKIFEDTAAEIRAIAQRRGRPVEPLEATVLRAKAYTAQEALELGIIDHIAESVSHLLQLVDGTEVRVQGVMGEEPVVLHTAGKALVNVHLGFFDKLLSLIADPNIAFLLISLGGLGIYFELMSPGSIFPGVAGLLALGLGFVALGNLPGNWVGAALILLAFALAVAEVNVDGFGVLGMMGVVSFVAGGVLLFGHFGTPAPLFPDISVSFKVLGPAAVIVTGASAALAVASYRGRRRMKAGGRRPTTTLLIGAQGVVEAALDPIGTAHVHGETWSARTASGEHVGVGSPVVVTREDGAMLTVRVASEKGSASVPDEGPAHSPEEHAEGGIA